VYIVHLLLQYGADPLLADAQGFNVLHLATHSSNIMLILYLLHQPSITADLIDPQDHTPIMWAAYQGDALSVDVFLRWGAEVKRRDSLGLTALHWAIVRGNPHLSSPFFHRPNSSSYIFLLLSRFPLYFGV
jgi:palmitoyltransferase ZDHHC13/17